MIIGLHFPFRFDPALLQADLARVQPAEWVPHYNERDYGGDWRGVALRSTTGSIGQLAARASGQGGFHDTPLLDRCPCFREVLSVFPCPLKSVRLLSLSPQSYIREHCDHELGYEDGAIRIHVPIQTGPEVEFYVCGERLLLEEGHSYYLNVSLPHRVNNRGASARIHLVIDVLVDEWVHELFRQGQAGAWDIPRSPLPSGGVKEFRLAVLRDAALMESLRAIPEERQFADTAVRLGHRLGFDFTQADVDAAMRDRPIEPGTPGIPLPTADWIPARVSFRDGLPFAEYTCLGSDRGDELFFEESVRAALQRPFPSLFRCEWPLAAAEQLEAAGETLVPSGFIFHTTRCGSTLISRMLAVLPGAAVIAEAHPIDQVVQAKLAIPELTPLQHAQWLRWMVTALGQRRAAGQTHYFAKLDAWHIHSLPLFRAAFPDTPWIFVYRNPLELMVSQLQQPGRQALPGAMDPRVLAMRPDDITRFGREEWCAQVLAGYFRSALAFRNDSQALFIDYEQLPEAVPAAISTHFTLPLTRTDVALMQEAARFDAGHPGVPFRADALRMQAEAPPHLRQLTAELLEPLYRELDSIRRRATVRDG